MHSTRPDARTEIAPVPEGMRTELAAPRLQTQLARPPTPATPEPRRRQPLLLAFALVPVIVVAAIFLSREAAEAPDSIAETPTPSSAIAPPVASETTQPTPPPPDPTPISPNPTPLTPLPPDPKPAETTPQMVATKPSSAAKKPTPTSFSARAKQVLGKLREKVVGEKCLITYPQTKPLALTIKVSASTGATQLVMPAAKQGGGLQLCLERALKSLKFSKGGPGEADLAVPYTLKP